MITIRNLIEARRADKEDEGGFTLIELLIVIVVLGILAAIVVFAVQNLTNESAESSCKSDAKSVEVATEAYKAQTGGYPAAVGDLIVTGLAPDGVTPVGPWLRSVPSAERYVIATAAGVVTIDAPGVPAAPPPANFNTDPTACAVATA